MLFLNRLVEEIQDEKVHFIKKNEFELAQDEFFQSFILKCTYVQCITHM